MRPVDRFIQLFTLNAEHEFFFTRVSDRMHFQALSRHLGSRVLIDPKPFTSSVDLEQRVLPTLCSMTPLLSSLDR
jgi:hypothetical protein